jgi:ABC-2 type transport system permease protein
MSVVPYKGSRWQTLRETLGYHRRVLRVIVSVEFKLKYSDSVLGYVWSIARPLAYFSVIWVLLGGIFGGGVQIPNYPLYLLLGIVIFTYFVDAVGLQMASIVSGGGLLRKIYFPRLIIPLSATGTATMTFAVNTLAVVVFIAASRLTPEATWLLIPPLLLELYLFMLGFGLFLAMAYTRFRDVGQLWDLGAQLLFFALPVMYSISFLSTPYQKVVMLNPVAQVMQDIRRIILGPELDPQTIAAVWGFREARAIPAAIAVGTFVVGLLLFQKDSKNFAERV